MFSVIYAERCLFLALIMLNVTSKSDMLGVVMLNAKCHYVECHYAECHYAECHFANCRGATKRSLTCVSLNQIYHTLSFFHFS